jgi:hypothetical protein
MVVLILTTAMVELHNHRAGCALPDRGSAPLWLGFGLRTCGCPPFVGAAVAAQGERASAGRVAKPVVQ